MNVCTYVTMYVRGKVGLKGPGRRVSARCIDARRSGLREMTQSPSRYITIRPSSHFSSPPSLPPSLARQSPSFRQLSCVPPLWRSLPSGAGLSAARLRLRLVPRGAHKFNAKVKAATTRSRSRVGRKARAILVRPRRGKAALHVPSRVAVCVCLSLRQLVSFSTTRRKE